MLSYIKLNHKRRKSVRWSAVPMPCLSRLCLKLKGKHGSGPGSMSYAFTHMDMGLEDRIWASRLGLRSQDWDLGLVTGIWREGRRRWKRRSLTTLGPLPCFPFNFKHNLLRQGTGTADFCDYLLLWRLWAFWAAAPKGSMTYAFKIMGNFLLLPLFILLLCTPPSNPSLEAQIPVLRPKSQSWDLNPSLEAQILASSSISICVKPLTISSAFIRMENIWQKETKKNLRENKNITYYLQNGAKQTFLS